MGSAGALNPVINAYTSRIQSGYSAKLNSIFNFRVTFRSFQAKTNVDE